jgi:hypothetical protein
LPAGQLGQAGFCDVRGKDGHGFGS